MRYWPDTRVVVVTPGPHRAVRLRRTQTQGPLVQVLRVAAAGPAPGAGRADGGVLEEVAREPPAPQLPRCPVDEVVPAVPAVQGVGFGRHASPFRRPAARQGP